MEPNNENPIFIRKNVYGQHENKIVLSLSIILSILILVSIGSSISNDFKSFIPSDDINDPNSKFCRLLDDYNVVTTPFAILIVIIFIILHKRRSFCINNFNWQNIGLPMVTSSWKKSDRFYSSLVYVRIAFKIIIIFQSLIESQNSTLKGAFKEIWRVLLTVFIYGICKFDV